MRGSGKTPITFSVSAKFQQFVRTLTHLDTFDAISLASILAVPYGTATRLLAPLKFAGYIEEIGRIEYSHATLDANPAFTLWRLNCQDAYDASTPMMRKSPTFGQYLERYRQFWAAKKVRMERPVTGKIRGEPIGNAPIPQGETKNDVH